MTMLDHSSVNALVDHILSLCRNGPTHRRFYFAAGGLMTTLWRFLSVYVRPTSSGDAELWFRVEYDTTGQSVVEHTMLKGRRLFFVDGPQPDIGFVVGTTVGSRPPPCGGSSGSPDHDASADDSQRGRLNDNLRGVFS